MAQSNLIVNHVNVLEEEKRPYVYDVDYCDWYKDVIGYLQKLVLPPEMDENRRRTIKLQSTRYAIIHGELWWRRNEGVLLKCIDHERSKSLLKEMHQGVCGGHYMAKTTDHKILSFGFWWPTVFKDTHQFVRKCDACQRFARKLKFNGNLPL